MALSEKLAKFWAGLNKGDIDWKFIYNAKESEEEKGKAVGWIIERGFVLSSSESIVDIDSSPTKYVVKFKDGRILNPVNPLNAEETLYFRSSLYAACYSDYLLNHEVCMQDKASKAGGLEIKKVDYDLRTEVLRQKVKKGGEQQKSERPKQPFIGEGI